MKKIFLSSLLIAAVATPVVSLAGTKSVTVDWTMPPDSTADVISYNMYYSYEPTSPDLNTPIANCDQWEEPSPNNFSMTCPTVEIVSYPVYFFIAAVTTGGEICLSAYDEKTVFSAVQNFQVLSVKEPPATGLFEQLKPNSDDIIYWQIAPNDGGSHFSKLSDDNDSTYSYVSTNWTYARYNFQDTSTSSGKVISKITMHIRGNFPASDELLSYLDIGYQKYTTSFGNGTGEWGEYSAEYLVNPANNSVWTSADIDNLKGGYHRKAGSDGETYSVSEIWIDVDYQD